MPLGKSFALFKGLASACTTEVWCLLMGFIGTLPPLVVVLGEDKIGFGSRVVGGG